MAACYHLVPKDLKHPSWRFSKTTKAVFIIASGQLDARLLVDNTLYNGRPPGRGRKYQKKETPVTPWMLDDVTSCEEHSSRSPRDGAHVVAEDGEKWCIKYLGASAT